MVDSTEIASRVWIFPVGAVENGSNPLTCTASFDLTEFARDYRLMTVLTEFLFSLRQLTEQVDDTLMAVSSEAMTSSLGVYDYIKMAAKSRPGLKSSAEQLGERFKAIKGRPPKAANGSAAVTRVEAG